jgi:hypothetical protein
MHGNMNRKKRHYISETKSAVTETASCIHVNWMSVVHTEQEVKTPIWQ